jgi:hypothetical protein
MPRWYEAQKNTIVHSSAWSYSSPRHIANVVLCVLGFVIIVV